MKTLAIALFVLACVLVAPGPASAILVVGGNLAAATGVDVQALTIVAGDNQSLMMPVLPDLQVIFAPLSVRVTDSNGKPVSGAYVYFGCDPAPAKVMFFSHGGTGHELPAVSDQNGLATLPPTTLLSLGPGNWHVTAYAKSPPNNPYKNVLTQSFTIRTLPRIVEKLSIRSGNNATAYLSAGKAPFGALSVTDENADGGSALAGRPITFACAAVAQGVTCPPGTTVTTDSSGVATLNGFAPITPGPYKITATAPTGVMVTFSVTVLRGCTPQQIAKHLC
jgi:hypothetical protein